MQWTDEGIVLGVKRHGEGSAIVELMTRAHGRHLGLVRGGTGSRLRPILQPGNSVAATWRARLDEHLGNYTVEGTRLRAAAFLGAAHAVYGVTHLAALTRLLPERDPHADVYTVLQGILEHLDEPERAGVLVVRFELDDRHYWLLVRRPRAEVCTSYPGRPEDLVVRTRSEVLARCHLRHTTFAQAERGGQLEIDGPRPTVRAFLACIRPSPFAVTT